MPRLVPSLVSVALVAGLLAASPASVQPSRAAAWGYVRLENLLEARDLGVARPGAIAYDAASGLLVLTDELSGRATRFSTGGASGGTLSRRDASRSGSLSARDAASGHTFSLDTNAGLLLETDASGTVLSRRDVSGLRLRGVAGIAVAPTADTTDATDASSLYVSVANASDGGSATGPGVLELALTAPVISASLAGIPDNVGHKVKEIDTTALNWDPFSPDPSGIAYANSIGKFVVVDGEIEEESVNNYPYPGINVWHMDPLTGDGDGVMDTTSGSPANKEPVGSAYDPDRDELYISRDGSSSAIWAYTRDGNQWVLRNSRDVTVFGVADAEGLAFANGLLYIGDGANKEIWLIGPGLDGIVATGDDILVSHFDTAGLGITDPEGVGIDHNTGHVWILSHKDGEGMVETLPDGTPVSTTHFDFATNNPGGLEIAPTSATSDDPSAMSAWVAQRGIDNNSDPNEKDGKIFEVSIQAGGPPPPPPDPGENLLTNGDFESGAVGQAPPGWSSNANFTTTDVSTHASPLAGQHFSSADAGYTIEQTVDATAGQAYDVVLWANPVPTSDAFTMNFKIQFRSASKAISTVVIKKINKRTPGGWDDHFATLTAPAGTTRARVMMVVSSLKTTVYVDDISFAAAP